MHMTHAYFDTFKDHKLCANMSDVSHFDFRKEKRRFQKRSGLTGVLQNLSNSVCVKTLAISCEMFA
jgi:hypothetical protein